MTVKQRVRAKADPFTVESVRGVEANYICLGSLLADDFPLEVVKELHRHGTIVMVEHAKVLFLGSFHLQPQ